PYAISRGQETPRYTRKLPRFSGHSRPVGRLVAMGGRRGPSNTEGRSRRPHLFDQPPCHCSPHCIDTGGVPRGARGGRRILRDDPVDLIYSTSPHATAHLIALTLAGRSGGRWVADFRDPW